MFQFVYTQLPVRFGNGSLAMHPFRLNTIEPGAFDRQGAHDHPTAASRFMRRLWFFTHVRPTLLTCHEALSHTNNSAVLPSAANRAVSHARNCIVTALTGRPSTKRRSMLCVS